MQTMKQFVQSNRVRMDVAWTDHNPNMDEDKWSREARHFKCTVHYRRRRLTVPFSQGSAHEREPTAEDVLDCLASDSASYDNARSFEDWANDFGYDADSRKAERAYKAIGRLRDQLSRLFGPELYETLLFETERL